jgi:hypothetical protein
MLCDVKGYTRTKVDKQIIKACLPWYEYFFMGRKDTRYSEEDKLFYIKLVQDDSKKIARDNNKKHSYIEIMAPKSSKYVWLEVDQGKIKYNTANNLK